MVIYLLKLLEYRFVKKQMYGLAGETRDIRKQLIKLNNIKAFRDDKVAIRLLDNELEEG